MNLLEGLCDLGSVDVKNAFFAIQTSKVIVDTSMRTGYIIRTTKSNHDFLISESDFPHQLIESDDTYVEIKRPKDQNYISFIINTMQGFTETVQEFMLFLKPSSDFSHLYKEEGIYHNSKMYLAVEFIHPKTQKKITLQYTLNDLIEFCSFCSGYCGEITNYYMNLFARTVIQSYLSANECDIDESNIGDLIRNIRQL